MQHDETTRLRALLERATQTPWRQDGAEIMMGDSWTVIAECTLPDCLEVADEDREEQEERNAALIVAAVNALPGLLGRVERAERDLAALRAQLATATASVRLLRADVELATAQRDAEACRADNAEAERDDLAALNVARVAVHALAMARVAELEAIIAGRTTPPTDEGEGDGGETPSEIVARLRRYANEARRCAAWEHSQGMHIAADNSCRDAREFDAQADRMAAAEVSRG